MEALRFPQPRRTGARPAAKPTPRRRVALMLDPRFSGGTGSAVAAEIRALARHVDLAVFGIETAMFSGRDVNPGLQAALDDHGLDLTWNPPLVRADTVVFHNPSCLKFDRSFGTRISCRTAFVVTHENFLRPSGAEGFDVGLCLDHVRRALVAGRGCLAPVSAYNRRGVEGWLSRTGSGWPVSEFDWFNVCDHDIVAPTARPRDRRGRHSRPGFEKFPPLETMAAHFPAHAESCTILGGDALLFEQDRLPSHWRVWRFGEIEVASFLREIDFFVYFTHPQWRESFGRVIAEAIAAGKLVITDPGTAEAFGDAVVASDGRDVDGIVRRFVDCPGRYVEFVRQAQASLVRFRPEAFAEHVVRNIERVEGNGHALL